MRRSGLSMREEGFTLLEVLAVILLAATLGAVMFQYFGSSLTGSSAPIDRLKTTLQLQQALENITDAYERSGKSPADLDALRLSIGTEGTDQVNAFGKYRVLQNRYIKFLGQSEVDSGGGDPKDSLKITLRNEVDEILSVLFTVQ